MTSEQIVLKILKLNKNAFIPTRATQQSAGLDLFSPVDCILHPFQRVLISINLVFVIPLGYYGKVKGRSGLALRNGISVFNGTIDPDYMGNIGILLFNNSENIYHIHRGERIAQFILARLYLPIIEEIDTLVLPFSERGAAGFGSTGKN